MVIDTLPKAKKIYLTKLNRIIDYELMKHLHEEEGYEGTWRIKASLL